MISGVHIPASTVRTGDMVVFFTVVYQDPSVILDTQ